MPIFDAYPAIVVLLSVVAYQLLPLGRPRVLLLCGVSVSYLGYLDLGALVVAVAMGTFAYLAVMVGPRLKAKAAKRLWMLAVIGSLLGPLVFYKYWGLLLGPLGIPPHHTYPWVPLGLSFLTFRLIAYVVDQQQTRAQRPGLSTMALFVLFFPIFICGPIERWVTFVRGPTVPFNAEQVGAALQRILYGVAKKVLLADRLAIHILPLSTKPEGFSTQAAWLVFIGCGLQIYLDFAAYSDIAIGLARLFGYDIMENFNRPFLSRNLAEFWRRWHISLSEWIRIYLFMPLATRRPSPVRLHLSTIVAMTLCGLWHGAGWSFVFWGFCHGIGISAYHLWTSARKRYPLANAVGEWRLAGHLSVALTYCYVSLTFVFFAKPFPEALIIVKRMFGVA